MCIMSSQRTALAVIDVQESFRHRPFWTEKNVPRFLSEINSLITDCEEKAIPIVRVFHTHQSHDSSNPFSRASGFVKPLEALKDYNAAIEIEKHKHSALVDTGLKGWLHSEGIQKLIICGIRTEQCCETTARHASDEGWQIDFASKAMLTFDMISPSGQLITAEEITLRTETVLAGRFARIC
jgi:nicotinamidase-related amidase